eukprot:365037-Chlamydomonas_euryale.AAC.2
MAVLRRGTAELRSGARNGRAFAGVLTLLLTQACVRGCASRTCSHADMHLKVRVCAHNRAPCAFIPPAPTPASATHCEERPHPVHLLCWQREGLPTQLIGSHRASTEVGGEVLGRELERVCVSNCAMCQAHVKSRVNHKMHACTLTHTHALTDTHMRCATSLSTNFVRCNMHINHMIALFDTLLPPII